MHNFPYIRAQIEENGIIKHIKNNENHVSQD